MDSQTAEQAVEQATGRAKRKATATKKDAPTNGVTAKPGEQGVATQPDEPKAPTAWKRETTEKERASAGEIANKLASDAQDMGAEAVVEGLIAVVDTLPEFTTPGTWPGASDEEFREAPVVAKIGLLLLRGSPKIEIGARRVQFLWRNKKTWTRGGVAVEAQGRSYGALATFQAGGAVGAVVVNYQLFKLMNPRRKVRAIYAALRSLDENGVVIPPQFTGFYDELELFGVGTAPEDARLARAIEAAQQRELPFADVFEEAGE